MNTTNITLDQLTPDQLKALHGQLKAGATIKRKTAKLRWPLVDAMLAEREGDGFKHTTAGIVVALQGKGLVDKDLSAEGRAEAIKMVQTRKQKLEKMVGEDGKLVHGKGKFGYKASAGGFGPLTVERVITWLATASKTDIAKVKAACK